MLSTQTPPELRQLFRENGHPGTTSGLAAGYVQCNLVILPAEVAADFLRFCQLNPRPCPPCSLTQER